MKLTFIIASALFLFGATTAQPVELKGHIGKPVECGEDDVPFCEWGSYALCWCPGEEYECHWYCVKEK